jgi:hypothetical protein
MGAAGQLSNIWHWKAASQEDVDHGFRDVTDLYPDFFKDQYPYATGEPPYDFPTDFMSDDARLYSPAWSAENPVANPTRTTSVDNLIAEGFGTLTGHPVVAIHGVGRWDDGRWRVIFSRDMDTGLGDAVSFTDRNEIAVAFAVWNGSNGEIGGRKQHSTYMTFSLAPEQSSSSNEWLIPGIMVGLLAIIVGGPRLGAVGGRSRGAGRENEGGIHVG